VRDGDRVCIVCIAISNSFCKLIITLLPSLTHSHTHIHTCISQANAPAILRMLLSHGLQLHTRVPHEGDMELRAFAEDFAVKQEVLELVRGTAE
jgi:hypothetical protein